MGAGIDGQGKVVQIVGVAGVQGHDSAVGNVIDPGNLLRGSGRDQYPAIKLVPQLTHQIGVVGVGMAEQDVVGPGELVHRKALLGVHLQVVFLLLGQIFLSFIVAAVPVKRVGHHNLSVGQHHLIALHRDPADPQGL